MARNTVTTIVRNLSACLLLAQAGMGLASAQEYAISTYAGGALPATPVVGTKAAIQYVYSLASDAAGNVYFLDFNCVFKLDRTGNLTLFAGNSSRTGYSGDGGPAATAAFNQLNAIAIDAAGNVYIADASNYRVRKISTSGVVTTVAGNGQEGYSGDSGAATSAEIDYVQSLAVDTNGNLYIADSPNHVIRKVSGGIITTVVGNGTGGSSGDGGAATSAELNYPQSIAVDASGNLYISDDESFRVRRVSGGVINNFAGNGTQGYSGDGGLAVNAEISYYAALAADTNGNLYISDSDNNRVRKVSLAGVITTIAGNGQYGYSGNGGLATSAALSYPQSIALDGAGNMYIADSDNQVIRKVSTAGIISTIGGNGLGYSGDGGAATNAEMEYPEGIALDPAGNLYIADSSNNRIRKVSAPGIITTIAGTNTSGYSGDGGRASLAQLSNPAGVALDAVGNLYVADSGNYVIRKISPAGTITTVAGTGTEGYSGDGSTATAATFSYLRGITSDLAGNLYVADTYNQRIRKIAVGGIVTTVAGNGSSGYSGDSGMATSAQLSYPSGVALDTLGNLYIADSNNFVVRKVSTLGVITTVAGNGSNGYSGDGGPATSAEISYISVVGVDASGNLYIADDDNGVIRKVSTVGTMSTIAGNGQNGYSGDGGLASAAEFGYEDGFAIDVAGNMYSSDSDNGAVRLMLLTTDTPPFGAVDTPAEISNVAGSVAFTGWSISSAGITYVDIWREPNPDEGVNLIYVGMADSINGARPDVAAAYPNSPENVTAGWGFLMLTNTLPSNSAGSVVGNGTYAIHAVAHDKGGRSTDLGVKTIVADNAHATAPFGAIDTPAQGAVASGSDYVNFGWALTPVGKIIPINGSTIWVYIDGVAVGHPVYDNYRNDIATLFPDSANSNGAVGYYHIDTTQLANGVHTISWSVTDSTGLTSGIGSRFFTVQN